MGSLAFEATAIELGGMVASWDPDTVPEINVPTGAETIVLSPGLRTIVAS